MPPSCGTARRRLCDGLPHLPPSYLHAAVTVAAYGKPTQKTEAISVGTVIETGNVHEGGQRTEREILEKFGAGDGI